MSFGSPLLTLYNSNNPTTTVNTIALTDANGFIFFIMRYQARVTKLLDVYVAVDNEDANLANVDGVDLSHRTAEPTEFASFDEL